MVQTNPNKSDTHPWCIRAKLTSAGKLHRFGEKGLTKFKQGGKAKELEKGKYIKILRLLRIKELKEFYKVEDLCDLGKSYWIYIRKWT